jgi:hypothetical protein
MFGINKAFALSGLRLLQPFSHNAMHYAIDMTLSGYRQNELEKI